MVPRTKVKLNERVVSIFGLVDGWTSWTAGGGGILSKYTVFQKSDAKIQITITTAYHIRIKYPLSSFNYYLSDVNVANFNKIHRTVSKQQLF